MRSGELERFAWVPDAIDEQAGIAAVLRHSEPFTLPLRPAGALSEQEMRELQAKGESSPKAEETAQWRKAYARGIQENAGRLSAVLWACATYQRLPEATRGEARPLAFALARFGHNGVIPTSAADRRAAIEDYVRQQMRAMW